MRRLRLIVNADDLGYDPEIDRGILEAHRAGLVTSASAMVEGELAARALRAAPPSLGVGLHAVIPAALPPGEVAGEIRRQLDRFAEIRGAPPTHLDSHRHAHAGALEAFAEVAAERRLPLRSLDPAMRDALRARGVRTADAFLGDAEARPCWTLERLVAALAGLAVLPGGTAELMAHPGYAPSLVRTSFGAEREVELRSLCHPVAREAIRRGGIALVNWSDPWPTEA